jgi:hypothetical protein
MNELIGRCIAIVFLATPLTSASPLHPQASAIGSHSTPTARLDSAIRNHDDGGAGASLAVVVMRGGDTLLLRVYGLADRENNRHGTPLEQAILAGRRERWGNGRCCRCRSACRVAHRDRAAMAPRALLEIDRPGEPGVDNVLAPTV